MKVEYKGLCLIAEKCKSCGGDKLLYFSMLKEDGERFPYMLIDGYERDLTKNVRTKIKELKKSADEYLKNPEEFKTINYFFK